MKIDTKKVFSCLFIAVVLCYSFVTFLSIGNDPRKKESSSPREKSYASEYPFEQPLVTSHKTSVMDSVNQIIKDSKSFTTTYNYLYYDIVEKQRLLDRAFFHYNLTTSLSGTKNSKYDAQDVVVKHENGVLSFVTDEVNVEQAISNVTEFSRYLSDQGIEKQLFFMPAAKHGSIPEEYQDVYIDHYDEMRQTILDGLQNSRFDVMSFDDSMEDFEADEKDLFFQTDHHWLPMTGISACRSIVPWLNENGFPVDQHIYDAENYKIDYSEIPFLGSQGRKVTLAYADLEKMPLVKPLYDSSLTVHLSYGDQTLSGTIEETLLADSYLKETNLYNNSHYNYYGHGSQGLVSIHNNNMHDGSRILVLKESFANCMYPYMPSMAEYIDVIDLRHFDGSLKGFISKNKPEAVIMIYGVQGFFGYRLYSMAENPFYFE